MSGTSRPPGAPATAIVASHNEAHLLERCLHGLAFCDELIVIDLESRDRTAVVADAQGARVVRHALVPIAELARVDVASEARHDWLVFVDPDEYVPPALGAQAAAFLNNAPPADMAVVFVPISYHFRGRPLRGTIWGGIGARPFLVRRSGVQLSTSVHRTLAVKAGYQTMHFTPASDGRNVIRHDWSSGYRDWLEKHRRYLRLEGQTRADDGMVSGYRGVARALTEGFRFSFFARRGYRDGARGFTLSALWAFYSAAADVALLRELRRRARL